MKKTLTYNLTKKAPVRELTLQGFVMQGIPKIKHDITIFNHWESHQTYVDSQGRPAYFDSDIVTYSVEIDAGVMKPWKEEKPLWEGKYKAIYRDTPAILRIGKSKTWHVLAENGHEVHELCKGLRAGDRIEVENLYWQYDL